MTKRTKIHKFYKEMLIFQDSGQQMQNFSAISPKLCQLGPKTMGHGV